MKFTKKVVAIVLMLISFSALSAELKNIIGKEELKTLAAEYQSFLLNDYISSDYCQEGWGDDLDAAANMRKACLSSQKQLLHELSNQANMWSEHFRMEEVNQSEDITQYQFLSFLNLGEKANLSCMITLVFTVDHNQNLVNRDLDLYCDH